MASRTVGDDFSRGMPLVAITICACLSRLYKIVSQCLSLAYLEKEEIQPDYPEPQSERPLNPSWKSASAVLRQRWGTQWENAYARA